MRFYLTFSSFTTLRKFENSFLQMWKTLSHDSFTLLLMTLSSPPSATGHFLIPRLPTSSSRLLSVSFQALLPVRVPAASMPLLISSVEFLLTVPVLPRQVLPQAPPPTCLVTKNLLGHLEDE